MKIAFLSNKLTLRGTEVALFDYAHYNETLLGNQSIVITQDINKLRGAQDIHIEAYNKFNSRFPVFYYESITDIEEIIKSQGISVIFIEKAGSAGDGLVIRNCFNIIHCVFNTQQPHGNLYCALHEFLNDICKTNVPVIPYMVRVEESSQDLKSELNIPDNALVFGTYSGADCFDIDYIRSVVETIGTNPIYSNIYFIFLNIYSFGPPSDRIKFIPGTSDLLYKRKFINTCDAMLYGRSGGETFGLSCGEFSLCNKPVIGRANEHSRSHLIILGDDMIKHNNYDELFEIITNWTAYKKDVSSNGYKKYTPQYVMNIFNSFLPKL
jgi:hypothetical protein